jgi:hypothetical protein
MMLRFSFKLKVASLAAKSFDYFQIQVDAPQKWISEIIPASVAEEISIKACLLTRSPNFYVHLFGAKSNYGVVGNTVFLASLEVDIEDGRRESLPFVFAMDGRDIGYLGFTSTVNFCLLYL